MSLKISLSSMFCFMVLTMPTNAAEDPLNFTAVCTALNVHGYWSSVGLEPEWSEDEKYSDPEWAFSYSGGDKISIEGIERPVTIFSPELLFAYEYSEFPVGATLRSYVINLEIKEIIATEVRGGNAIASNIKGKLISFDCKFSFN